MLSCSLVNKESSVVGTVGFEPNATRVKVLCVNHFTMFQSLKFLILSLLFFLLTPQVCSDNIFPDISLLTQGYQM